MVTVMMLLVVLALLCAIASAANWCPLWVSVVLLCVVELLRVLPLGT